MPASKFSTRLPTDAAPNALTLALARLRAAGVAIADLTESNPTRAGFDYPARLLAPLACAEALRYEPHPLGLPAARAAVAADARRRGAAVEPEQVVLTASTSEAYAWLFKLLCSPGERVLVPRPSYPLFEQLTQLEGVKSSAYDLEYHGRWELNMATLAAAATPDARALLVVSPNNPTGSVLTRRELAQLLEFCAARDLALIVDEVFADFLLEPPADRVTDVAAGSGILAFTLGGLSKTVGLPQLKLGWIVVGGPPDRRREALQALELIADSYLSVSTPVQVAAGSLLEEGASVREAIHSRLRENLAALRVEAEGHRACDVLPCEGGWSAVLRVPAIRSEERLVLELLERQHILVHPGYFFDFPREAFLVVSLLTPPVVFADATRRLLRYAVST